VAQIQNEKLSMQALAVGNSDGFFLCIATALRDPRKQKEGQTCEKFIIAEIFSVASGDGPCDSGQTDIRMSEKSKINYHFRQLPPGG
jgi:hypothetical protein